MKQISSIDLNFILKELEILKDSRIDKIYQPDNASLIFSFYKTNLGKKLLRINIGQSLFLAQGKEDYDETLGFGMFLRKHLDGYFLCDISQIKPERILKISFKIKDSNKALYLEFFGKGNAILCDENDDILNAILHHEFKDRTIRPKEKYKYPVMGYNLFEIGKAHLNEAFKNSKKGTLVTCLAIELGFGGIYAEEACMLSGIDKYKSPVEIDEKQVQYALSSIEKIISRKTEPMVILQNGNLIDAVPFDLEFYKECGKEKFQTFSEALEFFYSHYREAKETEFDKKLRSLNRIIEEQKAAIESLKKEEQELREKGELIYHKYGIIKEILDEVGKATKKYSWKDIKQKLAGHKIIKEINEKERKIIVEI